MSYIVPGERPRMCGVCPFARLSQINYGKCWCALDATNTRSYANLYEKLDDCPLIELPPHGRLGDLDKLMTEFMDSDLDHLQRDDWREVIQIVADAPTVIEAEGSE